MPDPAASRRDSYERRPAHSPVISVYTAVVYWMFRGKQRKGYTPASAPPVEPS
jgi:hypothetical protein